MHAALRITPTGACHPPGRYPRIQCSSQTKIWSSLSIMLSALLQSASAQAPQADCPTSFPPQLRLLPQPPSPQQHRQLPWPSPQPSPSPRRAAHPPPPPRSDESCGSTRSTSPAPCDPAAVRQTDPSVLSSKLRVHLDRLKRTHLDANLAAHAHRNIDVELSRINLRLPHVIRLLVLALLDVDTLRRALLLADLASHASQPCLPVRRRRTQGTEIHVTASIAGARSSGYCTVVSRSFET